MFWDLGLKNSPKILSLITMKMLKSPWNSRCTIERIWLEDKAFFTSDTQRIIPFKTAYACSFFFLYGKIEAMCVVEELIPSISTYSKGLTNPFLPVVVLF
ncbi:hypothetical protein GDO81_013352 [Engystomops pustulosus]|uniref:Uncharacterized protein n=1 Tax=Engystomops pustulosus TaxID=76066 RepID=A0AAV7B3E5_ENGPU|nr:hypothetical protein GDO81_013352 [Engystomops pustulosus]